MATLYSGGMGLTNPQGLRIMPCNWYPDEPAQPGGPCLDQSLTGYYVYRVLGAVVPLLPPRIGYALFERLGDLAYGRLADSRNNVEDNLRHVLDSRADPAHLATIARAIFRNQARNYCDLFRVARMRAEEIEHLTQVRGWENLERAMAAGKGAILVSAHFGNLDVVAQVFALRSYPVIAAAEHLRPERLFRYVCSLRASKGIRLVPVDRFLGPLFETLRQNGIVAIAADRNLTGTGMLTQFFGAPALLPDGHVRLALRTGAAIVPAFGLRKRDNTYEAYVEPALALERSGDRERDVNLGMARLVKVLEKYIGRYPEQWVMFQPVWRLPAQAACRPADATAA